MSTDSKDFKDPLGKGDAENKITREESEIPVVNQNDLFLKDYDTDKSFITQFLNKDKKTEKEKNKTLSLTELSETASKFKTQPEWILRELSHKLGVKGLVTGQFTEKALDLEGCSAIMSHNYLSDSLASHVAKLKVRNSDDSIIPSFERIEHAFSQVMSVAAQSDAETKKFRETQQLMIIPGIWTGHGLGVAVIGNRLIFTNTGEGCEGSDNSGTYIFKLSNPDLITSDFIKKLTKAAGSKDEFVKVIDSVKKADSESIFIHSKLQKRGSCSMTNPKKNIKGILVCLLAQERYGSLEDENIQKVLQETETPSSQKRYKDLPVSLLKRYKEFTNQTLRDDAITKLINLCKQSMDDMDLFEKLSDGLIILAKEYILQHHNGKDIQRAKDLFTNLPITYKLAVLKEVEKMEPGLISVITSYEPPPITSQFNSREVRDASEDTKAKEEGQRHSPRTRDTPI